MKNRKTGRPTKYTPSFGKRLVRLVERGCTLDEAAKEIGVHPATLYRWQNKYPALEADLREAMLRRDRFWYRVRLERWFPRPHVPWRKDCPVCGWEVVVRTAGGMAGFRFWVCERWPDCSFSSWRPPAPWICPLCSGTVFWSHSRKSVACETYWCGYREFLQPG
jgi:ribosomal protein S27AE